LQIFWKRGVDVLAYLTETGEDEHLKRLRATAQHHAKLMEADNGKGEAESALFDDEDDEDDEEEESGPKSAAKRVLDTEQHRKSRDVSAFLVRSRRYSLMLTRLLPVARCPHVRRPLERERALLADRSGSAARACRHLGASLFASCA
jgi:nitrogen fixation-related uncharacterized protein